MIDFHKFTFIYCVNNEHRFQKSWDMVSLLRIPSGYNIEPLIIRGSNSIAGGYNQAMGRSQAKYKIYLHQDVTIVNPDFLGQILYLFKTYPNLGLLGVLGAKHLPANGVWWEAQKCYGKVFFLGDRVSCNEEVTNDYESVQAIDGMLMVTQYDIPWREDLFDGGHFYDTSQSLEFIKAGYTVGVPRQIEPWCTHDTTTSLLPFQIYQQIFLHHYRDTITGLTTRLQD
ncbi:MAG TPA: glycosyltransferase family protein [Bacillota bacterium]|nr:glycosyltransferase family protein [Bacillota bacterium]